MEYSPLKYIYRSAGKAEAFTLLLLHGTGGNEHDLLSLTNYFGDGFNVLSVRGNVEENGMPRFFKRKAMGIFDEQDLGFRTDELKHFLEKVAVSEGFDVTKIVALGYSNGANIAGATLVLHPDFLAGAILFRPMPPFRDNRQKNSLRPTPVFLSNGSQDPTVDKDENRKYTNALSSAGFLVDDHSIATGHSLSEQDLLLASEWFRKHFPS
ncbi:alpha/beta hydrolase [Flavobacterium selenitireducens]|uniref:alpha/beta hydrolase n=1 Tax=Flavobacterium selenitireducens TaxID=2722704 RepID=UPI00168B1433|nr:alpha/beta hydrolase [Flavobacterium selenitireducens]MBD3582216.1 alpha/beta hydrolase [Flavobacterium selenitireducens]